MDFTPKFHSASAIPNHVQMRNEFNILTWFWKSIWSKLSTTASRLKISWFLWILDQFYFASANPNYMQTRKEFNIFTWFLKSMWSKLSRTAFKLKISRFLWILDQGFILCPGIRIMCKRGTNSRISHDFWRAFEASFPVPTRAAPTHAAPTCAALTCAAPTRAAPTCAASTRAMLTCAAQTHATPRCRADLCRTDSRHVNSCHVNMRGGAREKNVGVLHSFNFYNVKYKIKHK